MSQAPMTNSGDASIRTILVLAANPTGTSRLRLGREVSDIDDELQKTQYRDRFKLRQQWAVRNRDVQGALQKVRPQIVHFAGHGTGDQGLVFEDHAGHPTFIGANALANLFKLCATHVECVVLNACFSEVQARAIAQHIPYVIGMQWEIGDTAAQEFAVGFYRALGQGYSIGDAYEWGRNAIEMANISEEQTPVLIQRVSDSTRKPEGSSEAEGEAPSLPPIIQSSGKKPILEIVPLPQSLQKDARDESKPEEKDPKSATTKKSSKSGFIGYLFIIAAFVFYLVQRSSPPPKSPTEISQKEKPSQVESPEISQKEKMSQIEVPGGEFNYKASRNWLAAYCVDRSIQIQQSSKQQPFRFRKTPPDFVGARKAVEELIKNKSNVNFIVSSDDIPGDLQGEAEANGFELKKDIVARDAIAVAVNPNLKIDGLTLKELQQIYSGKSKTWSDLLGARFQDDNRNLKIKPFSREVIQRGTVRQFFDVIGVGSPIFEKVNFTYDEKGEKGGIGSVADNSGGIYFATATQIFGQSRVKPIPIGNDANNLNLPYLDKEFTPNQECSNIAPASVLNKSYPSQFIRPIYVVWRHENSETPSEAAAKAYVAMLRTKEGQDLLTKVGYFPVDEQAKSTAP